MDIERFRANPDINNCNRLLSRFIGLLNDPNIDAKQFVSQLKYLDSRFSEVNSNGSIKNKLDLYREVYVYLKNFCGSMGLRSALPTDLSQIFLKNKIDNIKYKQHRILWGKNKNPESKSVLDVELTKLKNILGSFGYLFRVDFRDLDWLVEQKPMSDWDIFAALTYRHQPSSLTGKTYSLISDLGIIKEICKSQRLKTLSWLKLYGKFIPDIETEYEDVEEKDFLDQITGLLYGLEQLRSLEINPTIVKRMSGLEDKSGYHGEIDYETVDSLIAMFKSYKDTMDMESFYTSEIVNVEQEIYRVFNLETLSKLTQALPLKKEQLWDIHVHGLMLSIETYTLNLDVSVALGI